MPFPSFPQVVSIAPPVVSQNYAVLEDHLHLVDSPENSLGGSPRRPITAQRLYRKRPSVQGRRRASQGHGQKKRDKPTLSRIVEMTRFKVFSQQESCVSRSFTYSIR